MWRDICMANGNALLELIDGYQRELALIRQAIEGRIKAADRAMVSLDQASGYGRQLEAREFWAMDGEKSITAREKM